MADNVIWDDEGTDGVVWDEEEPAKPAAPNPLEGLPKEWADRASGKVFNPRTNTTETRVNYKLVGPVEQGNTTGAPAWDPVKKKPSIGFMEAVLRKFGQGGFSRLADEGAGLIGMMEKDVEGQAKILPDGTAVPASTNEEQYRAGREVSRQMDNAADEKLTYSADLPLLGKTEVPLGVIPEAAGGIAQYLAAGPLWDKAGKSLQGVKHLSQVAPNAGRVRTMMNVAGANAIVPSAINAMGAAESDLTKGEVPEFLVETAARTGMGVGTAGLLGGATGAAANAANAPTPNMTPVLKGRSVNDYVMQRAAEKAGKARESRDDWFFRLLRAGKGDHKTMDTLGNKGEIADNAFDNGMVSRTTTPKDLLQSARTQKATAGQATGGIVETGDLEASPTQLPNVGEQLSELRRLRAEYETNSAMRRLLPQIDAEIQNIEASLITRAERGQLPRPEGEGPVAPRVSFRDNEGAKSGYDNFLDHESPDKAGQFVTKLSRKAAKENSERALQNVDPQLAEDFAKAKATFGRASDLEELALGATSAENANNKFGLGPKILAAGGMGSVGAFMANPSVATALPALGVAGAAGAHHVGQKYGPAFMATRANNLMKDYANTAQNGIPFESVAKALGQGGQAASPEVVQAFVNWINSGSQK